MLLQSQRIREEVWQRLHTIFLRYTGGSETISSQQLAAVVSEILREDSPRELDYVMLNLNRIDTDANGTIDFQQFATFLLKRHCGEIALQKMHINNKIRHGKERKITSGEFLQLLNSAYSFLGFAVDAQQADSIFQQADSDRDGLITYVEYFTYIDQYLARQSPTVMQEKVQSKPTVLTGREVSSRLRRFIWDELRRIYDRYDVNHSDTLDAQEIQRIAKEILKQSSRTELDLLLFNLLRLGNNGEVSFREFASFFLKHTSDIGLARFLRLSSHQRRRLSKEEFIRLFRSSFSYLPLSRVNDLLLQKLFDRIDRDRDNYISLTDFSSWVELFLCPVSYFGGDYYAQEDDEILQIGQSLILSLHEARQKQPAQTLNSSVIQQTNSNTYLSNVPSGMQSNNITTSVVTEVRQTRPPPINTSASGRISKVPSMSFYSQDLAVKVRRQVLSLIRKFDNNGNLELEEREIVALLQSQLKENKNEVAYVISNVFRYDKDNDKRITYDELANFLLEMHSGEMAIQRLHMHNTYVRGAERMMNGKEFCVTINYALSFFELQADDQSLWTLFNDVDRNKDGWISYQEYFEFLRTYFGSESYVVTSGLLKVNRQGFEHDAYLILTNQSLLIGQKLRKLYNLQLGYHVFRGDNNTSRPVGRAEIVTLLTIIFGYPLTEVEKAMGSGGLFIGTSTTNYDQFAQFMLGMHLKRYALSNFLEKYRLQRERDQLLSLDEFASALSLSMGLTIPIRPQLLAGCFSQLDIDRDGWITFSQFNQFISTLFESKGSVLVQSSRPNTLQPSSSQEELCQEIWTELRKLYDKYDTSRRNQLSQSGLQLFCREALLESSHKQLNYLTVSLMKSPVKNQQGHSEPNFVSFEYFAPFILNYVAETALKRFHLQQKPGKERLTRQEFTVVIRSAYNFLRTIRKRTEQIHRIFERLDRDNTGQLPYSQFISWVHFQVAGKPRY